MARKDRENMILEHLQAADAQGYKWDGLKAARKLFNPNESNFETQKQPGTFLKHDGRRPITQI